MFLSREGFVSKYFAMPLQMFLWRQIELKVQIVTFLRNYAEISAETRKMRFYSHLSIKFLRISSISYFIPFSFFFWFIWWKNQKKTKIGPKDEFFCFCRNFCTLFARKSENLRAPNKCPNFTHPRGFGPESISGVPRSVFMRGLRGKLGGKNPFPRITLVTTTVIQIKRHFFQNWKFFFQGFLDTIVGVFSQLSARCFFT